MIIRMIKDCYFQGEERKEGDILVLQDAHYVNGNFVGPTGDPLADIYTFEVITSNISSAAKTIEREKFAEMFSLAAISGIEHWDGDVKIFYMAFLDGDFISYVSLITNIEFLIEIRASYPDIPYIDWVHNKGLIATNRKFHIDFAESDFSIDSFKYLVEKNIANL